MGIPGPEDLIYFFTNKDRYYAHDEIGVVIGKNTNGKLDISDSVDYYHEIQVWNGSWWVYYFKDHSGYFNNYAVYSYSSDGLPHSEQSYRIRGRATFSSHTFGYVEMTIGTPAFIYGG